MNKEEIYTITLCLTHRCNLDCVYCFQKHDSNHDMSLETACSCIDWAFENIVKKGNKAEILFFGGEPLLRFDIIMKIFNYSSKKYKNSFLYFISTNGTILTDKMKNWFLEHKDVFCLGLSLDGTMETHNSNRSNSFDLIDISFFKENWPNQNVKMTLSEKSICNFAEDVKFIHSLGFNINGANLSLGDFDWSGDKWLKIFAPQLKNLVEYYVNSNYSHSNSLFDIDIATCTVKNKQRVKDCGIGDKMIFFDTDGKKYPCTFITPMTFSLNEIEKISKTDLLNKDNLIDEDCYSNCYIYTICRTCIASDYLLNKCFKNKDKRRCRLHKIIALFVADLQAKLINKNPRIYDNNKLYHTIEAIKKIRTLYLDEFKEYL